MNLSRFWPDSLRDLLFDADGAEIFRYIQNSANLTAEMLTDCERQKEIEPDQGAKMSSRIKDCLRMAGEVRFALNTVDNRMRRQRNANTEYRQFAAELNQQEIRDGLALLLDIFEGGGKIAAPKVIQDFIRNMAADINLSLMYRVELSELWDDILVVNREMHVLRLISLSHAVTELALQLQDSEVIKNVRQTLSQLNLRVTLPESVSPLNTDPQMLRRTLEGEVKQLEASKEHIEQLEAQRKALKSVCTELALQCEKTKSDDPPKPKSPTSSRPGMHSRTGMHTRRRRNY